MNECYNFKNNISKHNVLIICLSIHHGNTMKIARVISKKLNADLKKTSEVKKDDLNNYDLIGFASGIYNGKHHADLFKLIKEFEMQKNKKAFIFSTASVKYIKMHTALKKELTAKGFDVIDEFMCRGFMNYSFIKYFFGGINKNRPNKKDLLRAEEFAADIKDKLSI
jgi:flavodoxin